MGPRLDRRRPLLRFLLHSGAELLSVEGEGKAALKQSFARKPDLFHTADPPEVPLLLLHHHLAPTESAHGGGGGNSFSRKRGGFSPPHTHTPTKRVAVILMASRSSRTCPTTRGAEKLEESEGASERASNSRFLAAGGRARHEIPVPTPLDSLFGFVFPFSLQGLP